VRSLGEMAAQTLIERITGKLPGPTRRRVVPPRLVRRESTAVAPQTFRAARGRTVAVNAE
jgi:LacI family transcriptional regulator